jgi:hypothetical protein
MHLINANLATNTLNNCFALDAANFERFGTPDKKGAHRKVLKRLAFNLMCILPHRRSSNIRHG